MNDCHVQTMCRKVELRCEVQFIAAIVVATGANSLPPHGCTAMACVNSPNVVDVDDSQTDADIERTGQN